MKNTVQFIRFIPLIIAFVTVTLDLLSTSFALKLGYVETRIFGNNLLLEYFIFLASVFILQFLGNYLGDKSGEKRIGRLGLLLSYLIAIEPFIGIINNLNMVIGSL